MPTSRRGSDSARAAKPLPTLQEAIACPLLEGQHEEWIRCCTARFLPVARRVAGDDETAHDALQESWIAVLHAVSQYRGKPPACAWVRTIVRHEAAHQAQRQSRYMLVDPESDVRETPVAAPGGPDTGSEAAEQERQMVRILLELIDRLPPAYREVVRMRDIEERSPEAVAACLHISRSNVASRLNRAHALLRTRLLARLRLEKRDPRAPAAQTRQKKCDRSAPEPSIQVGHRINSRERAD